MINGKTFAQISFDAIDIEGNCKDLMKILAKAGYVLINISEHYPNPTYLIAKNRFFDKADNAKVD